MWPGLPSTAALLRASIFPLRSTPYFVLRRGSWLPFPGAVVRRRGILDLAHGHVAVVRLLPTLSCPSTNSEHAMQISSWAPLKPAASRGRPARRRCELSPATASPSPSCAATSPHAPDQPVLIAVRSGSKGARSVQRRNRWEKGCDGAWRRPSELRGPLVSRRARDRQSGMRSMRTGLATRLVAW